MEIQVPMVVILNASELTMYALGTDTALLLDCGDHSTTCIGLAQTYVITKSLTYVNKGARLVRRYKAKLYLLFSLW